MENTWNGEKSYETYGKLSWVFPNTLPSPKLPQ